MMPPVDLWKDRDFTTAAMLACLGALSIAFGPGREHPLKGSFGPGYFPSLCGVSLIGLAAVLAFKTTRRRLAPQEFTLQSGLRAWLVICAVVAFGVLIKPTGLVPATVVLVLLACVASPSFRAWESIVAATVLTMIAIVVFVWLIGLPVSLIAF